MQLKVSSAGPAAQALQLQDRPVFRRTALDQLLGDNLSPWNILPHKSVFVFLRPGAMMYQFDQIVNANNVTYSQHHFCSFEALVHSIVLTSGGWRLSS